MLLTGYIVRQTATRLVLTLLVLVGVYVLFDLADQGRRLAGVLTWSRVLAATTLHVPQLVVQLAPAAVLLAAVLTLAALRRRGELEALAASGYSSRRLLVPLGVVGVIAAAGTILLAELVVPSCEARADELYANQRPSILGAAAGRWQQHGAWFVHRGDQRLLALRVDARSEIAERLEGSPTRVEHAACFAAPGACVARTGAAWPDGIERPVRSRIEGLDRATLRGRLRGVRADERALERLLLATRASMPALNLVSVLLAGTFALGQRGLDRRRSTLGDAALALGLVLLLWAALALGFSLGRAGVLDATLGAWAPVATGLLAAAWLALRARR